MLRIRFGCASPNRTYARSRRTMKASPTRADACRARDEWTRMSVLREGSGPNRPKRTAQNARMRLNENGEHEPAPMPPHVWNLCAGRTASSMGAATRRSRFQCEFQHRLPSSMNPSNHFGSTVKMIAVIRSQLLDGRNRNRRNGEHSIPLHDTSASILPLMAHQQSVDATERFKNPSFRLLAISKAGIMAQRRSSSGIICETERTSIERCGPKANLGRKKEAGCWII